MPTLLNLEGFRFFFYSDERNEPVHVHVEKGDGVAEFRLRPGETRLVSRPEGSGIVVRRGDCGKQSR
jgi:hypothetical protein